MTAVIGTEHLTLGKRLAFARQLAGIEQKAFAPMLGVARPTLSAWERDVNAVPFAKVVEIARLTGQSVEWFAEGVHHKSEGWGFESLRAHSVLRQMRGALAMAGAFVLAPFIVDGGAR